MFYNYLKTAFRNLIKNKFFSILHVIGLSIGIASTLLILFYVKYERSYENMHEKAENIFRISINMYSGNEFVANDTETYQTLGPDLKETMPEVLDYVRFFHVSTAEVKALSNGFQSYEHKFYFTDPSAFKVFSYKILDDRNMGRFAEPFKMVISEKLALKYFGKLDVIGETMQLSLNNTPMEIIGVLENMPQNTHLKFDMLISHATLPVIYPWYEKHPWNLANEFTYLLMANGVQVEEFNEKLKAYSSENPEITNEIVLSEKISDIHLYSNKTFEPEINGNAQTVNFILAMGIFIMILAWINYVNLSTAKALERAKEVGIRKAIGSSKMQLIGQFYCEAFLVNCLACVFAVLLFYLAFPSFKDFTGQAMSLQQFGIYKLITFLITIVLSGTLLSGFYPALILSGFNPVSVLKGKLSSSNKGILLRKGLVFFQFTATVVLLCASMAVYYQMNFLTNMDLGVEIDNTLVIRAPEAEDPELTSYGDSFQSLLLSNSQVVGVTQANAVPGAGFQDFGAWSGIHKLGENEDEGGFTYYNYGVKHNYLNVMGIKMLEGRNFDINTTQEQILINEVALKILGFDNAADAIGQKITFYQGEEPAEILGVFQNFYQRSPKEKHLPMILWKLTSARNFIVKLNTPDSKEALGQISSIWDQVYPDHAFDYYFLNDLYNAQYHTDLQFGKSVLLFTFLSILIAILGLFGLSSYMVILRNKEMGIRKILGASVRSLIGLLSKDYFSLVTFAGIVALPIAYFLIDRWLENYATRFDLDWWLFIFPFAVILIVTMLTIGAQTLKAVNANPSDSLRNE